MDSETSEEELIQVQAKNLEKRVKRMIKLLRNSPEPVQNTVSQDPNATMPRGSLQPLRAGVAPGRHVLLPPITPSPPNHQQQQQPCCSSNSLPAVVQDPVLGNLLVNDRVNNQGDPCLPGITNLTVLDLAHPLKPVLHRRASSIKAPVPPVDTKGVRQDKPKKVKKVRFAQELFLKLYYLKDDMIHRHQSHDHGCQAQVQKTLDIQAASGSLSPVELRTPSALPPLKAPTPPAAPTVPIAPAPPNTGKPQTTKFRRFLSRPSRLRKAPSLHGTTVEATTVIEHKSEESVEAGEKEEVRECEVEEKPVRERVAKQASKTQHTRAHPKLVKLPSVVCPERTIQQAFRLLSEDDWEKKIEGLTSVRLLSQHHPEVLLPRLHDVCLAINREVKNLRSVVSRAAMKTLAHLFAHLGHDMDAEAEGAAKALMPKAGEASCFIREDVEMVLSHMVLSITPSCSMNALINTGLRHRNAAVRKATSQHLDELAEVMGESQVLSGKKNLTDRFVHAVSCLALDSAQEVRTHARNTLAFLASHPDLVKMVDKFAPRRHKVAVKDIIDRF